MKHKRIFIFIVLILCTTITFLDVFFLKEKNFTTNSIIIILILLRGKDILLISSVFFITKKHIFLKNFGIDFRTKIFNAHKLNMDLEEKCSKSKEFSICFLDINNFKPLNDLYGHDIGDEVLIQLCNRLNSISNCDVYRYGGDEFVIIIKKDINKVMKSLQDISTTDLDVYNNDNTLIHLTITFSIGFAKFPLDASCAKDLIKIADTRMYENKRKTKIGSN